MKKNQGITLIVLIITVLVMLILVGVSAQIIINSELVSRTKSAGSEWEEAAARDNETSRNLAAQVEESHTTGVYVKVYDLDENETGETLVFCSTDAKLQDENENEIEPLEDFGEIGKMEFQYDEEQEINTIPWKDYQADITKVIFKDKIRPKYTKYWFLNMSKLTTLENMKDNLDTSLVKSMRSMFNGCSKLVNIDLSNFNTANVTYMRGMFYQCTALKSLNLSSFNTENVTDMQSMFSGCTAITSITFGSNFNTKNVNNMYGMFYNCAKLKSLNLSIFNTENVTNMQSMFASCKALTSLNLSTFNTENVTDMQSMFSTCSLLTSITFGPNFNTKNVNNMWSMFYNSPKLASLDLSTFNTENVETMRSMFNNCTGLTSITFGPNFDTKNVNTMYYMFYGCSNLTSLDLSTFDTRNVTDMGYIFYNCSKLKQIIVGENWSTAKLTVSGNAFTKCSKLVGQNGTVYNSGRVTATYARIDTATYDEYEENADGITVGVGNKTGGDYGYLTLYTPPAEP